MKTTNMHLKILVVDDDEFILNLIRITLNSIGYAQVETVNNGYDAIRMLASTNEYDIVICDLCMPQLDGVEFIRKANAGGYEGGLIVLSGENDRVLCSAVNLANKYKLNILGALGKPVEKNLLENMISKYEKKVKVSSSSNGFSDAITKKELEDGIAAGDDGPIEMFYQPKINIRTGAIAGVEALARWRHQDRGLLAPYAFIPLAESLGLIDDLTRVVFRKAVRQTMIWHREGSRLVTAINFSVNSFADPTLADYIFDVMDEFGAVPELINIEVTETEAMNSEVDCLESLIRLRLHHFELSIDDFGTGNSSLSQLRRIPFTELKIDREFVNGAANNTEAIAMLESSINLAKKLGMDVVAEGAETREDWDLVERLGCDFVQGYYCAKPMDIENFYRFLLDWDGPVHVEPSIEQLDVQRMLRN